MKKIFKTVLYNPNSTWKLIIEVTGTIHKNKDKILKY